MRGINPKSIPLKTERDVKVVTREARILVKLGEQIVVIHNHRGRLSVIAIVGEGKLGENIFEKAVLCEIGIGGKKNGSGRGRPYRSAFVRDTGKHIPARNKRFSLSEDQYRRLAPHLFKLFQQITDERVSQWSCGRPQKPMFLPTRKRYYSLGRKRSSTNFPVKGLVNGVRFSVSPQDKLLIGDFYWAQSVHSDVQRRMKGLARYIDLVLSPYKMSASGSKFTSLKGAKEAMEVIQDSTLPPYLKIQALRLFLPQSINNPFWTDLCQILKWNGSTLPPEVEIAKNVPSSPWHRTGNVRPWEVRRNHNYVVFEVLPSPSI